MEIVHGALDIIGMIPVVGEIADGINAGIYLLEGDLVNAALSAAALIPVAGIAAVGGKFVAKYGDNIVRGVMKHGDTILKGVGKVVDDIAGAAKKITSGAGDVLNKLLKKNGDNTAKRLAALCDGSCFVAGTLILTNEGYKAIEDIQQGDTVIATDPETGETAEKMVVTLFVNETDELIHLTVNGEKISTTPTHPFYVPEKGWIDAVELRAGDMLVLVNGEYVVIEKTEHEYLESPITVYNFEVEDFHTYYVGEQSMLVHNMCRTDPNSYYSYKELKKLITANGLSGSNKGLEAHHLLEKQFASLFNVDPDDIISVALTPKNHRNAGKALGTNINAAIMNKLRGLDTITPKDVWSAHRDVYTKIGYPEWAEAIYKKYVSGLDIPY